MKLEIIKLICYSFGFSIILLFIYIIMVAVSFINYIIGEKKKDF